ncbi:MAG: DUF1517 domain-containing protein [Cyanobacteria bacterium J06621_8]
MPPFFRLQLLVSLLLISGTLNSDIVWADQLRSTLHQAELQAKRRGGRSGGGSFRSRPSRSNSSKSRSPRRKSTPRRSNYNSRPYSSDYDRDYRRTYRRSTPAYRTSRNSGSGELVFLLLFLITGGVLCYVVYRSLSRGNGSSRNKAEAKAIRERDNDRVTVSMLQVALSFPPSNVEDLQGELSQLSRNADTSTETGLVQLMQESALILLRNSQAWSHVLAQSETMAIASAESAFDQLSIKERSKFSGETLSNVAGNLSVKEPTNSESDDLGSYVVVTLIVGTADDQPLFAEINSEASLQEALLKISSMRDDFLIRLELLWTPQAADQYLTDDELLLEYPNILPLI